MSPERDQDTTDPQTPTSNFQLPTSNRQFLINRALIVLAVGAILAGLYFDQWRIVLRNAVLL
jgi:hypothetical protein